jgi:hypothetical protein
MRIVLRLVLVVLLLSMAAGVAWADFLHATDAVGRGLYRVDTSDGSVTYVGYHGVASGFCGLEYGVVEDILLGITRFEGAGLYALDPTTAVATYIGSLGIGYVFEGGLALDPTDGTLYGANVGSNEAPYLFVVNPTTGAGTLRGLVAGAPHDFDGLVFDDDGQLYGLDGETQAIWKIDKNDPNGPGTEQVGGGLGAGIEMGPVGALARGSNGTIYGYASGTHQLFTVDLLSGTAAVLHTFTPDVPVLYSMAFAGSGVSPVEPATWSRIKSMYAR